MTMKPYGKYLLVKILEKEPKKKGALIMVNEEEDPIVACELLDEGCDTELGLSISHTYILYFRRYELRDCVDRDQHLYLIKEEHLLGYDEEEYVRIS